MCDRCKKAYCGKSHVIEIRARFMDQGRYEGRRWLHFCIACWNRIFVLTEGEK